MLYNKRQVIFKDLLIFLFWFPIIPTLWKRMEAAFIKCIQWTPKQNKTEPVMLAWWTCTTLWKLINSQTWPEVLMPLLSLGYHRALTDNGSALHNLLPTWKEFQSELSDHKSQGTGMVLPQAVAENICISWRHWGISSTKLYVLVNTEGLGDEHSKKKDCEARRQHGWTCISTQGPYNRLKNCTTSGLF